MAMRTKGATSFADLPICPDRNRTYQEAEVLPRVRAWASSDGSGDKEKMDWEKLRKAFFWYDAADAENFGAYKLKFADVIDGKLMAVARGVFLAAAVMQGARGGVDIPDADRAGVRGHIARYYAKMRKEFDDDSIVAPWEKSAALPARADRKQLTFVPGTVEFKSYPAEFKIIPGQRIVEGYASMFGNKDDWGDVALRGMFARTLQGDLDRQAQGMKSRIKFCYQHDWEHPIGRPVVIEEDSTGLFTRSPVSRTPLGDEALTLIADDVISEMSIGYNPVQAYVEDGEEETRYLQEVHLFEYSAVTWGGNELTAITGVKGRGALGDALRRFAAIHAEMKEGRVLSGRNKELLQNAVEAMQALLEAAQSDDDDPDGKSTRVAADSLKALAEGARDSELERVVGDLSGYVSAVKAAAEIGVLLRGGA